jgi:hypothetical protein
MKGNWTVLRASAAAAAVVAWVGVFLFDPLRMSHNGEPVDGLFSIFVAWLFTGLLAAASLLPFVWRGKRLRWQRTIAVCIFVFALVVWFHVIASMRAVPYERVERTSTALVLVQAVIAMVLLVSILACAGGRKDVRPAS